MLKKYLFFTFSFITIHCIKSQNETFLTTTDRTDSIHEHITIHWRLAEYFNDKNQKDSARYYANKAKDISERYYNDDLLKSLLILSKTKGDSIAIKYYETYIKLNDSIIKNERDLRNKFARIEFETDNYIEENKKLSVQNILTVIIALIIIIVMILIHIIRTQKTKNEKLKLEKAQQKINEEMYKLMLNQQSKIEEGILKERFRISEELHDSIINRLVGSRLGIEFLLYEETEEIKKKYNFYINEIQNIEKDIRDLSHGLRNTKLDNSKDFIILIKNYLSEQNKIHNINYEIHQETSIEWSNTNDEIKINLFRIIQEAMHNIIKHAEASLINISFSCKLSEIEVKIIDDGIGFNTKLKDNYGIGLKNIASRVNRLNGKFEIDSKPNRGTKLIIKIPCKS